jgi:hypothetical protein
MRQWLQNVAVILKGIGYAGVSIVAEDVLPLLRLYSVAERIVRRRYASFSRPDQVERALSRINEKAGKLEDAERQLRRAVAIDSTTPDNFLFLGQFFARHRRPVDAIRAFEEAIAVAHDRPTDVEFARHRIDELRRLPDSGSTT